MSKRTLKLAELSNRTLTILAQAIGGCDARVILSERAGDSLTVALGSRSVILNPKSAGLYDLVLGARLLQHRALLHEGPKSASRKDRWMTSQAKKILVPAAQGDLRRRFASIDRLPGRFLPGNSLSDMRMVNQSVRWLPADWSGVVGFDQHGMVAIPDLNITGCGDDFSGLLTAIDNGSMQMSTLPQLEDLPYLRIPLTLATSDRFPLTEEWERHLSDPDNVETINALMKCHETKSIVRDERLTIGRHQFAGTQLDTDRLVAVRIGARLGQQIPLFRNSGSTIEPIFDPRQHLVVFCFDLNDLRLLDWDGRRSSVLRFLAVLLTVYQRLDVDVIVQATADRLIRTSDGKLGCLHFHSTLKSIDQEFDELFWNRLTYLMKKPPSLPGQNACFHPLMAEDIASAFYAAEQEGEHSYYTLIWWARHLMPSNSRQFRNRSFLERCAQRVDYLIRELARRDGMLDTQASYLPKELREGSQVGEYLHSVAFN